LEGHIEGLTGWSIGPAAFDPSKDPDPEDADDLYHKLRDVIVPLYYRKRDEWISVMRHAIAMNASFFNTHRMVQQYAAEAYV
jgi:starch phosphorylase